MWEKADGTNLDELQPEDVAENAVRWIDTSCMIVDCLTKGMRPDILLKFMKDGKLDLKASAESQMSKLRKQKQRAAKKVAGPTADPTIPDGGVVASWYSPLDNG